MARFPTLSRLIKTSSAKSYINLSTTFAKRLFNPTRGNATIGTVSRNFTIFYYLKNKRLDEARRVFSEIRTPDVSLYTMMIAGYCQTNRIDEALQMFYKMPVRDDVSWNSMMKGCIDCGYLEIARKLFDEMPHRTVVSWTTMISGFSKFGQIEMAEEFFSKMPSKDTAAWNSMIFCYCSYGRVEDAYNLFRKMPSRNVISWTTMISGLDQTGQTAKALALFQEMRNSGIEPTTSTFSIVLTACANILALDRGIQLHTHILKLGYVLDPFISSTLITFYARCKQINNSVKVFQENSNTNVVIWTALVSGYGLSFDHEQALAVFRDMINVGVVPNQCTFTCALNSCSVLEALDEGKVIHSKAMKIGLGLDVFVANSLIAMYSKCGNIDDGVIIFNKMRERNLVSWNSIIVGCAQHGRAEMAFQIFNQMEQANIQPDEITFVGLLTACSHSTLLEKGRLFFELLKNHPRIQLKLEHYACMVDILGRSGKLEEAEKFIKKMPIEPNSLIWLTLLSACKVHSNAEIATGAAECALNLEPNCSAPYILLSNLYSSLNKWKDASRIRRVMKEKGIIKQPGRSWVTLRGSRHEFLSGDNSHPLIKKIHQKLEWLNGKLKELGYVPDQSYALHDVEDEQKEVMLSYHSERLAIGFCLISTAEGSTLRVMKNLRVCGDCHSVIKLISKIVSREIIVRDSCRFHHFRDGKCSCGDHW
ncbi:pentatricopeptide repeat-containing protein At5g46460, mitochondrial-like [Papaver somniferum]|uniref:pentatricopeptide repeat-containing protein At5g46460, mitochondrial-like n=1 Tax=Papaver somniferum TaxID=3469 RepID=UPI000E6F838D|nr:pentatricopeptide repeat-containing protein At5g46460, mitochondrial-like [Papaver somniferum]